MRFELREITRKSQVTTIFVTHEQSEALSLSDIVAVMDAGEIVQTGTPPDLYRAPESEFVATFLSRSNLLPGEVVACGEGCAVTVASPLGQFDCSVDRAARIGDRVTLVVRPESIRLQEGTRACVRGVSFLGDTVECVVQLTDRSLIVRMPSSQAPTPGAQVGIAVDPTELFVLPK